MSQNTLSIMLQCLESQRSASFTNDDLRFWPNNHVDALLSSGILQQGSLAEDIECDGCEKHCLAEVEIIQCDSATPTRAYIYCTEDDEIGRINVPLEELKRWDATHRGLVDFLCKMFEVTSPPEEYIQKRLWWLGGPKISRMRCDIFLARGSTWPDAKDVFGNCAYIAGCSSPLILALRDIPEGKPFGSSARVTSLARLLSIEDSTLILDTSEITELLGLPRIVSTIPKDVFEPVMGDYRHIRYRGSVLHRLSPTQTIIVRFMHEEYERGHTEVPWGSLIFPEYMDHPGKMTDIFRPDDKYGRGVLIAEIEQGIYKLNI